MCDTAVVVCVIEVEASAGMSNLRTKRLSTRVNGKYFGNLGSRRRFLWGRIMRGVRPASIIWFPPDIAAKDEKK